MLSPDDEDESQQGSSSQCRRPLGALAGLRVHVIDAKMQSGQIESLYAACARYGLQMVEAEEAQVIVTLLKAPLRLARYLPLHLDGKAVLSPRWLEASVERGYQEPMGEYLVPLPPSFRAPDLLRKWQEGNVFGMEDSIPTEAPHGGHHGAKRGLGDGQASAKKAVRVSRASDTDHSEPSLASFDLDGPDGEHEDGRAIAAKSGDDSLSEDSSCQTKQGSSNRHAHPTAPPLHPTRYACLRATPLVCVNQDLVDQLSIIRHFRDMEGEKRSELAYSHAIAALKAWPSPLTSLDRAKIARLNGVGKKIAGLVEEYLETGSIARVKEILQNPRYKTLDLFWNIYDAGSVAVRRWTGQGLTSLDDVLEHAQLNAGQRQGIEYYHDFSRKMSRLQVKRILKILTTHLLALEPSTEWVVCGGYRRGKTACNDIDLILTTRDVDRERRLLSRLMARLESAKLLTSVLYFTERNSALVRGQSRSHRHASVMDPLDKAFIVLYDEQDACQRRVDLILAPREQYGTAILGWTGSKTFERDLRLYADRERGMKFDSGGIYKDGEYILSEDPAYWTALAREEEERGHASWEARNAAMERRAVDVEKVCFKVLGLPWLDPPLRNAD